jgi:hypothetical protein
VATVFPKNKDNSKDILKGETNSVLFEELEGGTREYIVTLSAIICDSKMKGISIVDTFRKTQYFLLYPNPKEISDSDTDSDLDAVFK